MSNYISQKELINLSLQDITEAYTRLTKSKDKLMEAGLLNYCSAIARVLDDISIQAEDLTNLLK